MIDWEAIEKEAIRIRRDLHTYPESGWLEFRTTSVAASMLESLGYEVRTGLEVIEPKSVMGRAPQDVIERNIARAVEQGEKERRALHGRLQGGVDATTSRCCPNVSVEGRFCEFCATTVRESSLRQGDRELRAAGRLSSVKLAPVP